MLSFMPNVVLTSLLCASVVPLLALGCKPQAVVSPTPDAQPVADASHTLVLGDISDEPAQKIEQYEPFARYLAAQLQDVDIKAGAVEVAPDMETMAEWLASGKVDIYFDSPYPAMIVSDLSGAQPILRRWKDGVEAYHSVIFTRVDSDIKTINDLKQDLIAFEEPFSTSGYMLPLTYLIEAGLQLVEQPETEATIAVDQVGYTFSEDSSNTIQWVLANRVAAGAVGEPDFLEIPTTVRQQLRILAHTESLPRHVVMLSPTLTPEEVAAIKTVLLAMDDTDEGQKFLATFEATTQFDEFPEGADQSLQRMRQLYDLIQK